MRGEEEVWELSGYAPPPSYRQHHHLTVRLRWDPGRLIITIIIKKKPLAYIFQNKIAG